LGEDNQSNSFSESVNNEKGKLIDEVENHDLEDL